MMAKKTSAKQQEVVLQIPDIGLSEAQIASLKKSFHNELVSSMKASSLAVRTVIVVVRIVREA
jgi:hypothetical protein